MWEETRAFARMMSEQHKNLKFTYFTSGVYFIAPENKTSYTPPRGYPGKSAIGFAHGVGDIARRIDEVNKAHAEGNEIASHANGHFNGQKEGWSKDEWIYELGIFKNILYKPQQFNPDLPAGVGLNFPSQDIRGFRAPELGVNSELYSALSQLHYRYDASRVSEPKTWPKKDVLGIWQIPLSDIVIGEYHDMTISMDFSIYQKQTDAQSIAVKGTPFWDKLYNDTLNSFRDYFNKNFDANRAPVVIANHFSKWNDGAYWEAMKTFAEEVCGRPEVRCTTYGALTDYLDSLSPTVLANYEKGNFPK